MQNLRQSHRGKTDLEIPYNYDYDIDGKTRKDWSSELDSSKLTQGQIWTSPQRSPQKTKFPYGLELIYPKVCRNKRTGKIYHRKCMG